MHAKSIPIFLHKSKARLLEPIKDVKCEDRKRKKKRKSIFHGIHHSNIVIINKILGKNPINQYITNDK